MPNTTPPSSEHADRLKRQAFWVCVGVASLTILDLSKINVGLPAIEQSLGGGTTELQLIVAGYALAFGLALVPSGRLGDIHSRRLMFIVGLSAFTAASILCALAPTIEFLIVARIAQGIAAGIQMPQVLGLIQQLYQGAARGRAFGLFGAVIGVSTAFGPTLGGLLIAVGGPDNGWRLSFWMNVPLGLLALFFAMRVLPKRQSHERERTELDLVGILLLGIATLGLMLPFVLTTGAPTDDPRRWFWLIVFGLSSATFFWWERHYQRSGKSPVVNFGLFRTASYRNGILITTAYFAAIPPYFLLVTLFLQQGLGLEPVFAGMVSISFALTSAVTSWIGGRLVFRWGRQLVALGLVTVMIGFVLVLLAGLFASVSLAPWLIAAAMTMTGAGGGLVISPNQTLTLSEVPVTQGGVAGSMAQVGQRVGTAIGVAAIISTFYATLYAEASHPDRVQVFRDGFLSGILVALVLIAVALVFALVDLFEHRPETSARPNA
ncbi:MFS transporter [Cryobacterium sp. Y57]|uniref:MFS transporter n=1 Tax=Cryobacterium sp. Y57 TaxID=2048287 RepID=UPI000CE39C9F|nr:MFS transporter [Cryobacterium sp. Y57]